MMTIYQFLPVFDFLTLTDQEEVLKTRLLLDASQEKIMHRVKSGLQGTKND